MHLKSQLLIWGSKLSNSKRGCRVSALDFFVKEIPQMAFWHRAHSDKCFFSFLFQYRFNAGKLIGVWNFHTTRRHRKTTILFTSIVYIHQPAGMIRVLWIVDSVSLRCWCCRVGLLYIVPWLLTPDLFAISSLSLVWNSWSASACRCSTRWRRRSAVARSRPGPSAVTTGCPTLPSPLWLSSR